jgi:hypothetical protein
MKIIRLSLIVAAAGSVVACMTPSPVQLRASQTPNSVNLRSVKRVAIMPMFNASSLGTDDPNPAYQGKYKEGLRPREWVIFADFMASAAGLSRFVCAQTRVRASEPRTPTFPLACATS